MSGSPISHGRMLKHVQTAGFAVTEATYHAGYDIPQHYHTTASLTFVLRGGLAEAVAGRTETLAPRELLLKPAATEHSNRIGDRGARLLLVEVVDPDFEQAALDTVFKRIQRTAASATALPLLRVSDELARTDQFASICIEGLLLQLVADLARIEHGNGGSVEPAFLRRTRERLHAEHHLPLRINQLARDEDIQPTRLSREFQRRYGCSIGDYLRRIRLERAMQALSMSSDAISTVALAAGFCDQSHLTRELRRATGLTPQQYRERTRTS